MMTKHTKRHKANGAALILVVVVTVLLAVIGVMFLMVSRLSEMETVAVADQRDLNAAVDTVVSRINEVLAEDLFGQNGTIVDADGSDEAYDATNSDDTWLASLEPVFNDNTTPDPADDFYEWPRITDLWGSIQANADSLYAQGNWFDSGSGDQVSAQDMQVDIIAPKDTTEVEDGTDPSLTMPYGARSDAAGDGVADSRWVKVPGMTTSRGKDVFAAIRIIDNCAMLNLNAAHCFYQGMYDTESFFEKPWFQDDVIATPYYNNQTGAGRYLTEINYLPFLRGQDLNGNSYLGTASGDDWYNLIDAKGFWDTVSSLPDSPRTAHHALMNIESVSSDYIFFDISDELELRNRYLVTSKVESRFEQDTIANFTLDAGGGTYGSLETPVDDTVAFNAWKIKIDSINFDAWDSAGNPLPTTDPLYRYDRRHVCTFYSFDRNIPKGQYPLLDSEIVAYANANWAAAGFSNATEYEEYLWEQWGPIFTPKGTVTTNIETPLAIDGLGNSVPFNNVETRRKILHLLYALREYYYNGTNLSEAALKAAQVVANIIDFSDDDAPNTLPVRGATEGPFYEDGSTNPFINYESQANVDCTFMTEQIIEDMIDEVSEDILGVGNGFTMAFGLNATDVIFGYERQPFISEIYAQWDGAAIAPVPNLQGFAIELINPYDTNINLTGWRLKIGSTVDYLFTSSDPVLTANTRLVIRTVIDLGAGNTVPFEGGVLALPVSDLSLLEGIYPAGDFTLKLLRPVPSNSGVSELCVDSVPSDNTRSVLGTDGKFSLQRDDDDWKFVYGKYAPIIPIIISPYNLGTENSATIADGGFQLGVPDDGLPLTRWHELEILSLYGNDAESSDPNAVPDPITEKLANNTPTHFDLAGVSSDLRDYLCTMNRPDEGTLPGRININTAPVHVIAAAIPPSLVDPNMANPLSLNLAQNIVAQRAIQPFENLSQLLAVPGFLIYDNQTTGYNVGQQSIEGDIEEEHWILSNLANKFTVRSDTFTAYILVRLGADGPQRRMIAIFDRSNVWAPDDRPNLVALHPVPDPR